MTDGAAGGVVAMEPMCNGAWSHSRHRVQNDAGEVPCPRIVAACLSQSLSY